ncbi:MAG: hypothetical protein ACI4TF_14240 [Oliverpabstia sp.]
MKIFAIIDEEQRNKDLAHLIYYEKDKRFYIELPDDADFWETPLLLASFVKQGKRTIDSYWSKVWVQQRIVPTDRQNLGQILKANGLQEYDEFKLLMLANGRCAQDSLYLEKRDTEIVTRLYKKRFERRVDMVIPLASNKLMVCFKNGVVKKCDLNLLVGDSRLFRRVLSCKEIFQKVTVQTGGYGVCWGEQVMISDTELYENGVDIPLKTDDLICFVRNQLVNSAEAAEILGCTRQYVNELTAKGKLKPLKSDAKTTLYLKSEVVQRLWK